MKLKEIIKQTPVWDGWRNAYNKFIPQFIEEAKSKLSYKDWNQEVFKEFFERSSGQCVSSLKQGYFTNDEKNKIKENWNEISPLLKQIAESQEAPLWDVYQQIQSTIRKYTESNRKAATYRLIAGLQPQLLCTIVNEKNTRQLLSYLNKNGDSTENIPNYTGNWFKDSNAIFTFYKVNSGIMDSSQFMTYPWQTIVYFEEDFDKNKDRDMSDISNELDNIKQLLEYKKQIILQGPPGTGKTKTAKDLAIVMLDLEKVQDLNNNEHFELIQFHPSYTYEDFVRGIISKPNENGEGVLFKTENKILAEFADKAFENLILSQEDNSIALQDKWIEDTFEEFKAEIEEKIEQENLILSGTITIFKVYSDCFKYGEDWKTPSRINFIDFKLLAKAVLNKSFDLNETQIPKDLSLHAHYRYTYYLALLRFFFEKYTYTSLVEKVPLKKHVLIIDEINRANLPSVLGELIYALEYRNEPVQSMYEYKEKREIILPSNLYIIGTMNTADRSVGHIDYAIKRRFAFVDILPSEQAINDVIIDPDLNAKAKILYHKVADLFNEDKNKTIYLQSDFKAKDVQLGHSYFLAETEKQLKLKLDFEIKPLLNEYVKDGILSEEALLEIAKL